MLPQPRMPITSPHSGGISDPGLSPLREVNQQSPLLSVRQEAVCLQVLSSPGSGGMGPYHRQRQIGVPRGPDPGR